MEYINAKEKDKMMISSKRKIDTEEKGAKRAKRSIPLGITKVKSALDSLELVEYLPRERIRARLQSNHLKESWGEKKSYNQRYASQNYENEVAQIKTYLSKYNGKLGGVVCLYKKPKHGWGRVSPSNSMGLTSFGKKTRNTFIDGLYDDFDLVNAQPRIIQNICKSNGIACPQVDEYCHKRGEILKRIELEYHVDTKKAKRLMLRLCFFGTFQGWCDKNQIEKAQPLPFITNFEREMKEIANQTKEVNPTLYESVRKRKEAKGNIIGSFYSTFLQEYELRIVEAVMGWLMTETKVMHHPFASGYFVGAYEYDGIKLLKENVDKYPGGRDQLQADINRKTNELMSFELEWAVKDIGGCYDISQGLELITNRDAPNEELEEVCTRIKNAMDDTGIIETIMALYPNQFVFCRNQWYCWNGSKWGANQRHLEHVITYKLGEHWMGLLEPFKEAYPESDMDNPNAKHLYDTVKAVSAFEKHSLRGHAGINRAVGRGRTLMANDDVEFDTNPDLLGFNNGVFDFNEEVFRPARFDDYVTWSCGYDFRPLGLGMKYAEGDVVKTVEEGSLNQDDIARMVELNDVLSKILPDEEVRELVYVIFASGLSGRAIEKFFVFNGDGRNGKTLLDEFNSISLGDYCVNVSPKILTENARNQCSGNANPEKAKLNKKRYVFMKEPARGEPLKNNEVKDLTGGGEIQARMLHSSDTRVRLFLTLVMECNKKPNFSEAPEKADVERVLDILFPSFFTSDESLWDDAKHIYPKEAKYKTREWMDAHKNAFMNLLITYLLVFKNEANYIIDQFVPDSVKQRSLEYLQDSFDIHNYFMHLFERGREGVSYSMDEDWTIPQIVKTIRSSDVFTSLPRKERYSKDLSAAAMKDFFITKEFYKDDLEFNTSKKTMMLKGWRLKVVDEGVV